MPGLLVLLLPSPLEEFEGRTQAQSLLGAGGAVAVEPPRVSYERLVRAPAAIRDGVASGQAKRLLKRLPSEVRAVAVFHPFQYPLARAIVGRAGCELWYGGAEPAGDDAAGDLHRLALERAALVFASGGPPQPLWERIARLGIA